MDRQVTGANHELSSQPHEVLMQAGAGILLQKISDVLFCLHPGCRFQCCANQGETLLQGHYAVHRALATNQLLPHIDLVEPLSPAVQGTPLHDVQKPPPTTPEQYHLLHSIDEGPMSGLATTSRQPWIGSTALHSPPAPASQPSTIPLGMVASSPSPSTGTANRASCPHCEKTFSREADMERHAKKHAPEARTFQCFVDGCAYNGEKGFYRRDKLMAHRRAKHGL